MAKMEERLRIWRATQSDGNASQVPYVTNGTEGYTTTTTTTTTLLQETVHSTVLHGCFYLLYML